MFIKTKILIVVMVLVALLAGNGCTLVGVSDVEEPAYEVVESEGDLQIRQYGKLAVVETTVAGEDYSQAGDVAFKRLFKYISGNNAASTSIEMTAPVLSTEAAGTQGEKIAMTAPVLNQSVDGGWRYAFILPSRYNPETAPRPLDESLKISQLPASKYAVYSFSGGWGEAPFTEQAEKLNKFVRERGLRPVSPPIIARYNPPWTLPFFKRNEIMVEID